MARHFTNYEQNARIIDEVTITSANMGIAQLKTEDHEIKGREVTFKGQKLVSFGSCSYLGLEQHPAIKAGAIDAINRYGTQFSSSRAYVSLGLYDELETLLGVMFEAPAIVSASTSLGHFSNIPTLVGSQDIVILDAQVHASVQLAVQLLKARNIPIEIIRHNRMDMLEDRVKDLKDKYNKVWYMADGVYSMYGDYAPLKDMMQLVYNYPQLNLYIDDAHGMSWAGKNGVGYARTILPPRHEQVFLVTSLNKAFAAGGGVMLFPNDEYRRKVRNCGSTMIFSGPVQPPLLGAAIASANVHLSPEIGVKQIELRDKIQYFVDLARKLQLPLISNNLSPIKFIGVGKPGVGYGMVRRLMERKYYVNLSVFPSVSYNNTGLRIPITNHHSIADIEGLLYIIAEQLPLALAQEDSSIKLVHQAFKMVG